MVTADNIDPSLFDKWTEDIDKARKSIGVQGTSVAVVYKGKIIYAKGFGKRNDTDPFTPETLAPIASITKGFTAAAIGELVAKKKAKWDDPVHDHLPEFQVKDPRLTAEITFTDLLSHRTGLPGLDMEWYHRPESRLELIKQLKHVDAIAPFRAEWIYNNVLIAVAGEAAARIAGKPYEDLVLETVTRPLGMVETGFSLKEMVTRPNHALPYSCTNFGAAQKGVTYQLPVDMHYMTDAPAGDLFSNVIELANWVKALMHGGELDGTQVLDKGSVEQITSAHCLVDRKPTMPEFSLSTYGLGMLIGSYKGHNIYHHIMFPDDDLAIMSLSNNDINMLPLWIPYYIADDVLGLHKSRDWLFDKAFNATKEAYKDQGLEDFKDVEKEFPPQIKDRPPTRELSYFAGEYVHPVYGKIVFKLATPPNVDSTKDSKGGEDALAYEFMSFKGYLEHYHYDSFRLRYHGDGILMALLFTFVAGDDGSVQQCRLLRDDGHTLFTKVKTEGTDALAKEK
ncbi:hypothetical protein BGW42_000972 [Actinomortierella wolfii]|nr:hypothetical protein BGW42_000972 [Actinomortierella wolfii]